MTFDEIKSANSIDALEKRLARIVYESENENADATALLKEAEAIESKIATLKLEQRKQLLDGARTKGFVVEGGSNSEGGAEVKSYDASSPEFLTAWLKDKAVLNENGTVTKLFGEMTDEEQKAFIFTTSNTPNVIPTVIKNEIIELVEAMTPMLEDATKSGMSQGFGVPRHKEITDGDADVTDEGVANDDEEDAFDLLTLDGVEIKKHIKITRKMKFKSLDAFKSWIIQHLAERIAVAKEKVILSRLDSTTYGIAAENVKTAVAQTDAGVRALFALLKGKGSKKLYANNYTIWNVLANITDEEGRKIFYPDSSVDLVEGRIYGATVRLDDNLADNVIYGGYANKILANDYDELALGNETKVTDWVTTYGAYSLFDAALENPNAMFKATFATASAGEPQGDPENAG